MRKVRIRENSWIARLAARKLKFHRVAIVIGRTIFLYNVTSANFIKSRRWVMHELKHVEQFEREGWFRFLWLYMLDYLKAGYYNNRFEIEARNAETEEGLLFKYDLSAYLKPAS